MNRPMRICTWNAQGLENKGPELKWIVDRYNIDICLLSETKLADETPFTLNGYTLYTACHPHGLRRGGSAVLIKDDIPHRRLPSIVRDCEHDTDRANTYVSCLQVARIGLELFDDVTYEIGAFYAPSGHAVLPDHFKQVFQTMGTHFLLGGDFNGHHKSWGGNESPTNWRGKRLYKAIEEEIMEILSPTNFPTYIPHQRLLNPSILDFFIGKNVKFMCDTPEVICDSTSDHKPVLMVMGVQDNSDTGISKSKSVHQSLGEFHREMLPSTSAAPIPPESEKFASWSESLQSGLHTLRVCTWDCQGLLGKAHELQQYAQDVDILMISQIQLPPGCQLLQELEGYDIYRADHPSCISRGGSAILIRKSIKHVQLPSITEEFVQMASVAIRMGNKQFNFGAVFLPPEYNHLQCEHYMDVFEELAMSTGFMIGGGFNARHARWNCSDCSNRGNHLFQLIEILRLDVLAPSLPTFYPSTGSQTEVVDFFIGKGFPRAIARLDYNFSSSDHLPVYVELHVQDC